MTKYLLKELAIAEDELAKCAPNSGIKASMIELPSTAGNDLRLHIEFAMRHTTRHRADEAEIRSRVRELLVGLREYMARYAQSLDRDAAVKP